MRPRCCPCRQDPRVVGVGGGGRRRPGLVFPAATAAVVAVAVGVVAAVAVAAVPAVGLRLVSACSCAHASGNEELHTCMSIQIKLLSEKKLGAICREIL